MRDVRTGLIVDLLAPNPFATWTPLFALPGVTSSSASDGTITVSPFGGIPPYSYQLGSFASQASNFFSGLDAGPQTVVVTDSVGCQFSFTAWVSVGSPLTASIDAANSAGSFCAPQTTGRLVITAAGGTPPYTYFLNGVSSASNTFSDLSGGYYNVTVEDNVARVFKLSTYVYQAPAVQVSWRLSYQTGLFNWGITAKAAGGYEPQYLWTLNGTRIGSTTGDIFVNARAYGVYTLTASTAFACSASTVVYFYPPPQISTSLSSVSCFGASDGSINATVSQGGSGLFSYRLNTTGSVWGSDGYFANLAAGTYRLEVLDNLTSIIVNTYAAVSQPSVLAVSVTGTRVLPSGGSLQFSISGGTPPYQISVTETLGTGYSGSSDALLWQYLPAGLYSASVVDSRGCTASLSSPYTLYLEITVQGFASQPSCHGGADGVIDVSASGGNGDYQYALTPSVGSVANFSGLLWQSGQTFSNLAGGSYLVLVKDSAFPSGVSSTVVTLDNPSPVVLSYTSTGTAPGAATASISFAISGGVGPYLLNYSTIVVNLPVTDFFVRNNVGVSNQSAVATDDRGCASPAIRVVVYDTIAISASVSNVLCRGSPTGQISLTALGGSGNNRFRLIRRGESSDWQSSPVFSDLPAGLYNFLVEDVMDGAYSQHIYGVQVNEPALALQVLPVSISRSTYSAATGSIRVTSIGNQGLVEYQLDTGAFVSAGVFLNVSAGEHNVTARDAAGCRMTMSASVFSIPAVRTTPAAVSCSGRTDGSASFEVLGGQPPFSFTLLTTGASSTTPSFAGLPAGPMQLRISDSGADGDTVHDFDFTIPDATPITSLVQTVYRDNRVQVFVSGGTGGPYRWQPNGIESDSPVFNGPFPSTVTVLDSAGCAARVELQSVGYGTCMDIVTLTALTHTFSLIQFLASLSSTRNRVPALVLQLCAPSLEALEQDSLRSRTGIPRQAPASGTMNGSIFYLFVLGKSLKLSPKTLSTVTSLFTVKCLLVSQLQSPSRTWACILPPTWEETPARHRFKFQMPSTASIEPMCLLFANPIW
jgi:large repetitive protein